MCDDNIEYDEDGEEIPRKDTSAWMICPVCEGEGHHAKELGSFTMSEFHECFDDEESRERYFAGEYDKVCNVCHGSGKIRESQLEDVEKEECRLRMLETGRNEAGEPI